MREILESRSESTFRRFLQQCRKGAPNGGSTTEPGLAICSARCPAHRPATTTNREVNLTSFQTPFVPASQVNLRHPVPFVRPGFRLTRSFVSRKRPLEPSVPSQGTMNSPLCSNLEIPTGSNQWGALLMHDHKYMIRTAPCVGCPVRLTCPKRYPEGSTSSIRSSDTLNSSVDTVATEFHVSAMNRTLS